MTVKVITVQHKNVLRCLEETGKYESGVRTVPTSRSRAYDYMMKTYGYKNPPIFLAPVGQRVEFCGANFGEDCVAIELDIPADKVRIQEYYDWSDFIYFVEESDEEDFIDTFSDLDEFGKYVLLGMKNMDDNRVYQLTVDYLDADWVTKVSWQLDKLKQLHNCSGGANVLGELSGYV